MKLFKNYALIKQTELDDALKDEGERRSLKDNKALIVKLAELQTAFERKEKAFQKTHQELIEAQDKIEVYQEERDEVRDVVKQQIENDDRESFLEAKAAGIAKKEAALKEEEKLLETAGNHNYKKGYADGVADGLRKISEITQKDRDNAMQIAMVSAASHTPVANLQELNNVHSLTAGSSDK